MSENILSTVSWIVLASLQTPLSIPLIYSPHRGWPVIPLKFRLWWITAKRHKTRKMLFHPLVHAAATRCRSRSGACISILPALERRSGSSRSATREKLCSSGKIAESTTAGSGGAIGAWAAAGQQQGSSRAAAGQQKQQAAASASFLLRKLCAYCIPRPHEGDVGGGYLWGWPLVE